MADDLKRSRQQAGHPGAVLPTSALRLVGGVTAGNLTSRFETQKHLPAIERRLGLRVGHLARTEATLRAVASLARTTAQ